MAALSLASRASVPFSSGPQAPRQQRQPRRLAAVRALAADEQQQQPAATEPPRPANVCATCGSPDKAFGCDGSGRIAGGIGAVPGLGWWPIKAYRPCPKASAAGVQYQRKGQITDEVLFGKGRQ